MTLQEESGSRGSGSAAFVYCPDLSMSRLCTLAVLALTFEGLWCPGEADVGDFTPCLHFFYRSWPPKGLIGTPICQRYCNRYRFASLYSRVRRSPWFSAYIYSAPEGKRPSASWKFEPQVSRFQLWIVPFFIIIFNELMSPTDITMLENQFIKSNQSAFVSPDGKTADSSPFTCV